MTIGTITAPEEMVVVPHFTRQDLGFVRDQKMFEELRAKNPLPLAPKAQQLVEHRGLQDPLATGMTNAYA